MVGSLILGLAENYGVGLALGWLAWIFVAGLVAGLYVQMVRAPRKRVRHIREDVATPEYEAQIMRIYRLPIPYALQIVFAERTDALLSLSATHALRLFVGNAFLAITAIVFFLNSEVQFATMWQPAISFGVLVMVLMFRPSGILGENIQEKV